MSKYAKDLALGQLVPEVDKLIGRDSVKNQSLPYTRYPGKVLSPMSSYTQRARELRERASSRPAPYSGRLGSVLSRPAGFREGAVDNQIESLRRAGSDFSQNRALPSLQRQFGTAFSPMESRFAERSSRDGERTLNESRMGLENLNSSISNLDNKRNEEAAKALYSMQTQKIGRQNNLVGSLNQFGDQMHGYNNMQSAIDRNRFAEQRDEKMQNLARLADENDRARNVGFHPDFQKPASERLIQSLRAYGVDPTRPVDEWEASKTPPPQYPGKGVASVPDEINYAGSVLERLNPSLRGSLYEQRKNLTKSLSDNPPIGESALTAAQSAIGPKNVELDSRARKQLKKDQAFINNKYIKLNQYGSEQHMAESARRVREIEKSANEQRSKLLLDGIKNEASNLYNSEANNISKLGMMSEAENNEFNNILGNLRNLNSQGATKWRNEQALEEDAYRNFQNEKNWAWPGERNNLEARNEAYRGVPIRNIDLDRLGQLDTRYSEQDRDARSASAPINSAENYWQNDYAAYQKAREEQAAKAREKARAEEASANAAAQAQAAQNAENEKINAEKAARKAEKERKRQELWDIMTPNERFNEENADFDIMRDKKKYSDLVDGMWRTVGNRQDALEEKWGKYVNSNQHYNGQMKPGGVSREVFNQKMRETNIKKENEKKIFERLYGTPHRDLENRIADQRRNISDRSKKSTYVSDVDGQTRARAKLAAEYKQRRKEIFARAVKEYEKELRGPIRDTNIDQLLLNKLLAKK